MRALYIAVLSLLSLAYGQETPSYPLFKPNQEIRVSNLPALVARSHDPSDVLQTSLDMILHDRSICCGRDSALEDSSGAADPRSIKDITAKLQGRHLLGDGRPIQVTVVDLAPLATRNPRAIVDALAHQHALLMVWKSHLYVLYGARFDEGVYSDGTVTSTINELYLLDARYSHSRRAIYFTRQKDDWNDVDGLLLLTITTQ